MEIKAKVRKLVRKYKTRNPFEMIRGMNVILVLYPLKGVRGFYQYFQRNNIIYIDEALSDTDKAFVLAHEIGHMLLHKKSNAIFMDTRTQFKTTRYELEADKFAMELLISDEFLEENSYYTVEQISRMTGYSQKLIKLRLNN
ncbi:MAG: ImmA/IrrE family metallo-endopeptidase [Blautia sp.]|uniref:ImmA/IrrE family metallo-endopeptidase n=1 Tax=Blautia sp. TaxID=1955243 RepID=UPI0025BCB0B5|nr:ImmA/IrrE family metallo-endopeptidase [Blautia sp.]MCI7449066.1 ImmA/IrrE family metallo-endopeptidase [Blautia sp.]